MLETEISQLQPKVTKILPFSLPALKYCEQTTRK